ncbi:MAG: hypothetical protein JWR05_2994 [Mucilaginibacter sp.]|nr:hypothetical protein [Mucilaginibacter sp.]
MKARHYIIVLFCAIVLFSGCKKEQDSMLPGSNTSNNLMAVATTGYKPLTVKPYAGTTQSGYVDGPVKNARFNYLQGIDMTTDGTIYLADRQNAKIRKITPAGIVSTVNIPNNNEGHSLYGPARIRVQKDGTINILTYDESFVILDKTWIVKPNGQVFTPVKKPMIPGSPGGNSYNPYTYNDLQKDPYTDKVLIGGIYNDHTFAFGIIENFEIQNGAIGTNTYRIPNDSLNAEDINSREVTAFFCGYNKVKYIVFNGKHIYKLTPSGQFTQIYRNLEFKRITCIIGTKDSRTLYIADLGSIKAISNKKLTYLVGPHYPHDGGDGIGSSADVYADQLALTKDESTIYFTNNNCLRQLFLR